MNRNRKPIRLTESQLHRVIKESVKRCLFAINGNKIGRVQRITESRDEDELYQVNVYHDIDGDEYPTISRFDENEYKGRLIDTVYMDGNSFTDWCEFVGTESECEDYINEHWGG